MTLINPITTLITDILAQWDNTNVTDISADPEVKSIHDYANDPTTESNGVIVLNNYDMNPIQEFGDYRHRRYIVDAEMIMSADQSKTSWEDTLVELERSLDAYNDTNTGRYYRIFNLLNNDNDSYYNIEFNIQVDVKVEEITTA